MTDKVQKIREEVKRRMNCFKNERNTLLKASDNNLSLGARIAMCEEILSFINSLQEDPVNENLNTESMIESYKQRLIAQANGMKNSPLIDMCLVSYKHGINETLDTLKLSNAERTVKNWEEPVSDDLDKAAENHGAERYRATRDMVLAEKCKWSFKAGAEWQKAKDQEIIETAIHHAYHNGRLEMKEQLMAKAFDFTKEHNIACVLASECLRNHGWFSRERDFNDLFRHLSCVDKLFEGKFSGKTKVIVIKED
jgi:hypothetical protein